MLTGKHICVNLYEDSKESQEGKSEYYIGNSMKKFQVGVLFLF